MRKTRHRLSIILSLGCLTVIVITAALVLSSEQITGADAVNIRSGIDSQMPTTDQSPVIQENRAFLEAMRQQYARLQSVIFDATINIQLWREGQVVSGQGTVKYRATGNLYRYEVELSDELVKAGLMRNVAVAWNGKQHFFYDRAIDVLSIQPVEERRNIAAVPNPFFLPLDFLAWTDDSSCSGCMMRLQDIGALGNWEQRRENLRVISSEQNPALIHDLLAASGGIMQGEKFDYNLRIVGRRGDSRQLDSISRTKPDGQRLVQVVFSQYESVDGAVVKFPFETKLGAMKPDGSPALLATFKVSKLMLNTTIDESEFRLLPGKNTKVVDTETYRSDK